MRFKLCLTILLFLFTTLLLPLLYPVEAASDWSEPVNLSSKMQHAWFPDIVVDGAGTAHVVFLGSDFFEMKDSPIWEKYDKVYYNSISPEGNVDPKGPYNISVSPYGVVPRSSVAFDNTRGILELVYRSRPSLNFQYAPAIEASIPTAWSTSRNIDDFNTSYYSDILVDKKGTIHVVWTQIEGTDFAKMSQVVMYRRSEDFGKSWSYPKLIGEPKYGATKVTIKADISNGLHVSWDDGYDNQTGRNQAAFGGYTHSFDDGNKWSDPLTFGSEKEPIAQTTLTTFGENGVMLAWRVLEKQQIFYMVSQDNGLNFSEPTAIPDISARRFSSQHFFDRYYLAGDGNGRVHLAAIALTPSGKKGEIEKAEDLAAYHVVWENGNWLQPEIIGIVPGFAEYPRIGLGPDRIHVVWFARNKPTDDDSKSVWYSSKTYDTGIQPQPIGTYTRPEQTPQTPSMPVATVKPQPVLPPVEAGGTRQWLEESYTAAALAIIPVFAIGGLLAITITLRNRHRGKRL
ncbi:sialidase family protein [Candidatus Chlorohelix sp.]|uniref:sialidase family protein n=1 Tax=Candidatus Chlorohelix sp. TaxID=3139201 RepID=UPI003027B708